jgi:hypothetical protein
MADRAPVNRPGLVGDMNTGTRKGFKSCGSNLVSTIKSDFPTKSSHALTKDLRQGGIVNTAVSPMLLFEFPQFSSTKERLTAR